MKYIYARLEAVAVCGEVEEKGSFALNSVKHPWLFVQTQVVEDCGLKEIGGHGYSLYNRDEESSINKRVFLLIIFRTTYFNYTPTPI
jgi:hypothetical protein